MLHARFVVCVSGATAQAVIARAPGAAGRIRVIHSGLSPIFTPGPVNRQSLERLGVHQPYVLYVGSEQLRKNLRRLVSAVREAKRSVPSLRLVKVGGHQTTEGRKDFLSALRSEGLLQHTTILPGVSDDQLVALYRGAAVTALLSLQEGFGFPALEAMACGCPTIVSGRASLPEITGGDALVVDPLDTRDIARAVESTIADEELHRDLSRRGAIRAAAFTWDRAARAYADLYEEAIRQP